MRKKVRNSLILIVLVAILGVGFGIYRNEILGRYAFYRGEKCFEAEEYEKATKYLKTSLGFNPDNPRTHLLLMKTYWARGLWEEMREERDRIIALGEEAPPIPLVIRDLENMHITTPRSSEDYGWHFEIPDCGSIEDDVNEFADEEEPLNKSVNVCLAIECNNPTGIGIQAGDTLEITYDSGKRLTIYLPAVTEDIHWLYIAPDGSTYYDKWLTQPAQLAPSEEKT